MIHGYSGLRTHSYSDHISLERLHTYFAANSVTNNANFIHQVAYMSQPINVMITIEGLRLDIDSRTSSSQSEHANHYTNGKRHLLSLS